MPDRSFPTTPDSRYFVVRGRLWRKSDPGLSETRRAELVHDLMNARRGLRRDASVEGRAACRAAVQAAKLALGERGPVWWDDGAPDHNRRLVKNTPYAEWFAALEEGDAGEPGDRSGPGDPSEPGPRSGRSDRSG